MRAGVGDGDASPRPVGPFLIQAVVWNVALFGLIRLTWFDQHAVSALVHFQEQILTWYGAAPQSAVVVTSACSGADVLALLVAFVFAYPAPWAKRLAGAMLGVVLLLTLNAVRIGSLFAVADDVARLNLWHVYIWPAVLTTVTIVYAVGWMQWTEGRRRLDGRWVRFGILSTAGLVVYAAAVPFAFTSTALAQVGIWTAGMAAMCLTPLVHGVQATGALLTTSRGAYLVTQECLFTPLLPFAAAAVGTWPMPTRRRLGWFAALLPVFFALGVARVLVLALPASLVGSPMVFVHGFYQFIAGAVVLTGATMLGSRSVSAGRIAARVGVAVVASLTAALVVGPFWAQALDAVVVIIGGTPLTADAQDASTVAPVFQLALLIGLWLVLDDERRPWKLMTALAMLAVLHVCGVLAWSAWTTHDVAPHPLLSRAWAMAIPAAIAATWLRSRATIYGDSTYASFWRDVGEGFPSLSGAASTLVYFEGERRLLTGALATLDGCTLLKSDLWDEAKNTRILQWAADQGARVYGMDLSEPIVQQARSAFGPSRRLRPVQSDVRAVPFADGSFDAVYSMGTVEHFDETADSVRELARVLKPGGRLILGVPNRCDPFLRAPMVAVMQWLGVYGYGYEKSYSRRGLRRLVEDAGLEVCGETGILFMPGWLRMLDLWCHTRAPQLARLTAVLVHPFLWLERHAPVVHQHGYLIAVVGQKPGEPSQAGGTSSGAPQMITSPVATGAPMVGPEATGIEWVIDVSDCDPVALCSLPRLQALVTSILEEFDLHPLAPPVWHVFGGAGGVTGLVLLAESHLTIHTYPEARYAALNLYCCRRRESGDWHTRLTGALGARCVGVRELVRPR